jgi:hypothetical protein
MPKVAPPLITVAGETYTFDVLRLVPFVQTGVNVINFGGAVVMPGTPSTSSSAWVPTTWLF